MPNIKVVNMAGKEVGELALSEKVFGAEVNEAVLHTAVRAYLMNQRQGTQSLLQEAKFPAAAESPGSRRVPVTQDRVAPVLLSGYTAVSLLVLSLAAIV